MLAAAGLYDFAAIAFGATVAFVFLALVKNALANPIYLVALILACIIAWFILISWACPNTMSGISNYISEQVDGFFNGVRKGIEDFFEGIWNGITDLFD